jgi:hypothetical protein
MGDSSATVNTTPGTSPSTTFAATLKRSVQTYVNLHTNLITNINIPQSSKISYSFSSNAIVVDFSGFDATKLETLNFLHSTLENVEGIKFLRQGKVVEIAFAMEEHVDAILEAGLVFQNRQLPITKAFHPDKTILSITVCGLPFRNKEDTYHELVQVFAPYGSVAQVKFHYYTNTTVRMDSCHVVLELRTADVTVADVPRTLPVFSKYCDLFWFNAPKFCRYCKTVGHTAQQCEKIMGTSSTSAKHGSTVHKEFRRFSQNDNLGLSHRGDVDHLEEQNRSEQQRTPKKVTMEPLASLITIEDTSNPIRLDVDCALELQEPVGRCTNNYLEGGVLQASI